MWLLVRVVRGSKHFDPESRIENQVLISDSSDLVISGRSFGAQTFRFEARKAGDSFTIADYPAPPGASLSAEFAELARQLGAVGAPLPVASVR